MYNQHSLNLAVWSRAAEIKILVVLNLAVNPTYTVHIICAHAYKGTAFLQDIRKMSIGSGGPIFHSVFSDECSLLWYILGSRRCDFFCCCRLAISTAFLQDIRKMSIGSGGPIFHSVFSNECSLLWYNLFEKV